MTWPSNSARLLCSAISRRLCLSASSSCRARSCAAATAISLARSRDGSEAALAAQAPPTPSPSPIGALAAAPSLGGTLADRPSAGTPAGAPLAPASAADAARGALRASFFLSVFLNCSNFPSGMGPSTRPCAPPACGPFKWAEQRSHPAEGLLWHCAPTPPPHVRAMHLLGSIVSGVKRRHSSSANDAPAPGSTPAGAWSADGTPEALLASSSPSPAAP